MIAFLTGRLAVKGTDYAVLDVRGVGYRMAMSTNSLSALPVEGDEVTVHTHMHVREDDISLFGFESIGEKELFARLITVSGIGPKVALAALSSFDPDALAAAIMTEDVALVSSIPGVGKKTAQRLILELKDKLGAPSSLPAGGGVAPQAAAEAREALTTMGFSSAEVASALRGYDGSPGDAGAMLRYALKRLGGGA